MAEYVKFRLTAAKVGVTMAFAALLAGLAEKVQPAAAKSSSGSAHLLSPIPPFKLSSATPQVLSGALIKLDSALIKLENKLSKTYFTIHKADTTFLKIKTANTTFLKTRTADSTFLKIDDANSSFLKIDDANANFLKIDDASLKYLKIDGTAADSSELGGLSPQAYFHGTGGVASGMETIPLNTTQTVLQVAGGELEVAVSVSSDGISLQITNNTGELLPAVLQGDTTPIGLKPNGTTNLPLIAGETQAHQTTLQILPAGGFTNVVTIVTSSVPTTGAAEVIAQAFTGGV